MAKTSKKIEEEVICNKIENKQNEIKDDIVDIDKLIALRVAELLAQKELELRATLQKEFEGEPLVKSKKIKPSQSMSARKYVPDDTMIRISQNISGKFIISETRGSNYFIELNGYGDSTTMAYKDLKNYHGRHHSFLNRGKLKITNVTSEDNSIDFNDVIHDLNLQRIYDDESKISPLDIEYYLLEEDDLKEFSMKLRNSREILSTIVEISFILYKDNKFNDNSKMDVIRQLTGDSNLYTHQSIPNNIRFVNPK